MTTLSPTAAPSGRAGVVIWALVRVPALVLLVYLLRFPILTAIEKQFDIFYVTLTVVDVVSTPVTRLIAAVALVAVLLLLMVLARNLPERARYPIVLVAAGIVIALAFSAAGTTVRRALVVVTILATNLAPEHLVRRLKLFPRAWNTLMLVGVGVVELFLWREYWRWVRRGHQADVATRGEWAIGAAVPGLLLTSLVFAFLIRPQRLLPFEQRLRMPAAVRIVENGLSINWLDMDPTGTYLYVTGHEVPRLRRYDVRDWSTPPILSDVATGGAQGFAYDARANEIYVFNAVTHELFYLDATTLKRKRVVEVADLSPGDLWVTVDPITDTLTLSSEADLETGVPFIVLNRTTGQIVAREDLATGNALLHPTKPWLYLTFFRRHNEVLLYDLHQRAVVHSTPGDPRAERMVFSRRRNELLVTSPMESRIMRFNADQLQLKGFIPTMFGVRAIALDEERDLLLYGNIATGHLVVVDVESGRPLRRYYLGPWLRTIQLHVETGTAYVSSRGALYRVEYAR
jgi:hypothetical protein